MENAASASKGETVVWAQHSHETPDNPYQEMPHGILRMGKAPEMSESPTAWHRALGKADFGVPAAPQTTCCQ